MDEHGDIPPGLFCRKSLAESWTPSAINPNQQGFSFYTTTSAPDASAIRPAVRSPSSTQREEHAGAVDVLAGLRLPKRSPPIKTCARLRVRGCGTWFGEIS